MSGQNISCPGGAPSQTGIAVQARYPDAQISSCGKIPDVQRQLNTNDGPFVVPIWNSHEGEVKAADFVWNLIEAEKIRISDIWAKRIEFWFVRRIGINASHGKVGSVIVAQTQCSNFLKQNDLKLESYPLTTSAYEAYREGAELDGVLVAPGQGEGERDLEVVDKNAANLNNFTTFVRLASSRLSVAEADPVVWLSGVAMRPLNDYLGDVEQSFFEQLFESVTALNDIPKLIFVFDRIAKVGLLFEGARLCAGDLLDAEEIESGDISIYEEAGVLSVAYTEELTQLFEREFSELQKDDFILHQGVSTCMFACPPLGLYTHGYKAETVEPVVRFYISKLFELIDNGVECTASQAQFFERHKESWQEKRSMFMEFRTVSS